MPRQVPTVVILISLALVTGCIPAATGATRQISQTIRRDSPTPPATGVVPEKVGGAFSTWAFVGDPQVAIGGRRLALHWVEL